MCVSAVRPKPRNARRCPPFRRRRGLLAAAAAAEDACNRPASPAAARARLLRAATTKAVDVQRTLGARVRLHRVLQRLAAAAEPAAVAAVAAAKAAAQSAANRRPIRRRRCLAAAVASSAAAVAAAAAAVVAAADAVPPGVHGAHVRVLPLPAYVSRGAERGMRLQRLLLRRICAVAAAAPPPPGSPPPPPPFAMDIQFLADHPGADWQIGIGLFIVGIVAGRCLCNKGRGGRGGYVPGPPPSAAACCNAPGLWSDAAKVCEERVRSWNGLS